MQNAHGQFGRAFRTTLSMMSQCHMDSINGRFTRALTKTVSMMNQCDIHIDDKNWDVQLLVDTTIFKCQRSFLVANFQYFEAEFANFEECRTTKEQPFLLPDIDATIFEKILRFLRRGKIHVNEFNVLQFLIVSDSLGLRTVNLKKKCVEYVKSRSEKSEPISNVLGLLHFAFSKEDDVLVDILNTHICQHLYHYSKDMKLMDVQFEILATLVKCSRNFLLPLNGSANIMLAIVHNWMNHHPAERKLYRKDLWEMIDFDNVCFHYAMFMGNWLRDEMNEMITCRVDDGSPSKSTISHPRIDYGLIGGNSRCRGVISFFVKNLSKWRTGEEEFSPSCVISDLWWKASIRRIGDDLSVNLYCDGTDSTPDWNCYASAVFIIKSQTGTVWDFKREITLSLFSSNMKPCSWGPKECLKWNELIDPQKGYVDYDDSTILDVHVLADVPFVKTIQGSSGFDNRTMVCE